MAKQNEGQFNFLPHPKRQEATRLLPYVMAVMVYLCSLCLTGGLMLHNGFDDWTSNLKNRLTIQIVEQDKDQLILLEQDVIAVIEKTSGVKKVDKVSDIEVKNLLEPWIGKGNVTNDLPIPSLINVELAEGVAINLDALRAELGKLSDSIMLDDHQQWLGGLVQITSVVEYIVLGIFILIVVATICVIALGTKAGMAEHQTTIRVMHMLGAYDHTIARAYQDRFMRYGIIGGIVGLFLALLTYVVVFYLTQDLLREMAIKATLPWLEMSAMVVIPVLSALLAMSVSRQTALRELKKML